MNPARPAGRATRNDGALVVRFGPDLLACRPSDESADFRSIAPLCAEGERMARARAQLSKMKPNPTATSARRHEASLLMLRCFTCAMCCCCGAGPGPLLRRCPWGPLPCPPVGGFPPPPPPPLRRLPPPLLTPLMPLLALLARWAIACCCGGGGPCWGCWGWGCGSPGRVPSTRPSPCRGPVRTVSSLTAPVCMSSRRALTSQMCSYMTRKVCASLPSQLHA